MNAQVRACRVDGVIGLVAEHQVDHVGQVVFAILLANGECGRCQGAVEDTNSVQTIEKLLKVQTETERYCLVVRQQTFGIIIWIEISLIKSSYNIPVVLNLRGLKFCKWTCALSGVKMTLCACLLVTAKRCDMSEEMAHCTVK
jgi:hypothetical protein